MNYEALIQNRQSIRAFHSRALKQPQREEIRRYFEQSLRLLPEIPVSMELFSEEFGARLEGVVGYHGNAFFAPEYLVLLSEKREGYLENAGFLTESLLLKLTDMELDSCWLTVTDSAAAKRALRIGDRTEEVAAIIAFGYGKAERDSTRIDINTPSDVEFESRKGHIAPKIAEAAMVYDGLWGKAPVWGQFDPYLDKALYAASLAPSFLNRQTYRYLVNGKELLLCETKDALVSPEDRALGLGATMFNYYIVHSRYYAGVSLWTLGDTADRSALQIPADYEVAATCKLW